MLPTIWKQSQSFAASAALDPAEQLDSSIGLPKERLGRDLVTVSRD